MPVGHVPYEIFSHEMPNCPCSLASDSSCMLNMKETVLFSALKHWQEMQYMLSALQIGNRTAPNPGPPFQSAYIKDCKL